MKNKEILGTFSQKETMYKMIKKINELAEGVSKTVNITVSNESEIHHSEVSLRLLWICGDEAEFVYKNNRPPIIEVEGLLNPLKEQMDKEIREVCSYCDKINLLNPDDLVKLYKEKYEK